MAGCAKKPVPEPVPVPMTEAFLLKHTKIVPQKDGSAITFTQYRLRQHPRFNEQNATVNTFFIAHAAPGDQNTTFNVVTDRFLLYFSMKADRWGGFTSAQDTLGEYHTVHPYTSYIRKGVYYENLYINLDRRWLEAASHQQTTLLFLGRDTELTISIPPVYPTALLHSLEIYRGHMPDIPVTSEDNATE